MSPAAGPLDRSTPPPPGPARPFAFPEFEHRQLRDGLELYVAPLARTPLVHLRLLSPAGAQLDPPRQRGLAALTAALVDEGTAQRSSTEIALAAERLGGHLTSSAGWDSAEVSIGLLAADLRAGWDLLAEVAMGPEFPDREVSRLKALTLAELKRRRAQPALLGAECTARALYGSSPYGAPLLGTSEAVAAITRADVASFHERHYRGNPATLVAVGDLDSDAVAERARAGLEGWVGIRESPPVSFETVSADSHRIIVVDRPLAPQTELRIAQVGIPRSHPDHFVAAVMNSLLGGKFMSRINLNLRERHGFTYGASSRFARRLGPGPFSVTTALANEVVGAAVREVLAELSRLCEEPVTEAELADTKSYLQGVFPYTVQTIDGVASRLEDLAVFSLPLDYYDTFADRLAAVTADDILRVARELLAPHSMTIVAVGPPAALAGQLEELGPVETWRPDEA